MKRIRTDGRLETFLWRLSVGILLLLGCAAVWALIGDEGGRWPQAPGIQVLTSGKLQIDASNVSEGYFVASAPGGVKHRLKLRVSRGDATLTYDLSSEGEAEVFPLQLGSGEYEISLYENLSGKKYAQDGTVVLSAELSDENLPFLYPNQYVNYTQESPLTEAAMNLASAGGEKEIFEAVCNYITSEYVYDFIRAVTISPGMLPDISGCMEKRMGICQDLSAMMAGMLRVLGIPSRLVIGYADDNYHAWTVSLVNGEEIFYDPTAALNAIENPKEYTVERYY